VRKPQLSVSIALKSKALLPGRGGDEKVELNDSSDSDLLRLRTILTIGRVSVDTRVEHTKKRKE